MKQAVVSFIFGSQEYGHVGSIRFDQQKRCYQFVSNADLNIDGIDLEFLHLFYFTLQELIDTFQKYKVIIIFESLDAAAELLAEPKS